VAERYSVLRYGKTQGNLMQREFIQRAGALKI